MANPSWPGSLPQYVLESGFSESDADALIETGMEAGRPKTRRRFTTSGEQFTMTIVCDATQRATFKTFYNSTTQRGSVNFDWLDPVTRAARTFRFRRPPPKYSQRGAAHLVSFAVERVV